MSKRTFIILLIVGFTLMLGFTVISPFLPELVGNQSAGGLWMGIIFAGFGISRGIIMPIVGKVSDKRGRKVFMAAGLFFFTITSLGYPLANTVQLLTLVRVLHGLAAGLVMPIMLAYTGDVVEKGKEAVTSGVINMMFYLGLAAGPFFGGVINKYLGFNMVFYLVAGMGAAVFFAVLFFLPESAPNGKEEGSFEKTGFFDLMKYNFIKAVILITIMNTLITTVYMSYVPSLASGMKINIERIGLLVSVGVFLAGILQIPFGKIADRLNKAGRSFQVVIGSSVSMAALVVMPLCPNYVWLMIAGSVVGVGAAISTPALMSLAIGIGKKAGMGAWMGILQSSKSVAFIIAPLIFGVIMDHMGINAVFYLMSVFCFFGSLWYLHYIHRRLLGYKREGFPREAV